MGEIMPGSASDPAESCACSALNKGNRARVQEHAPAAPPDIAIESAPIRRRLPSERRSRTSSRSAATKDISR